MKLHILIVDFALVAAVFLPYFLFILIGKREQNKIKIKFSEETRNYQLRFDEVDSWNNNIVGLDRERGMILLVRKRKTDFTTELIDLKQVRTCEILQEVETVRVKERAENVLQKISLELNKYNAAAQIVTLYDCEDTYAQDYEIKHAEKWVRTINEIVAVRPTLNFAA